MALNIRHAETERLASELAEMTGENKTTAVREALRDRLERLQGERSGRSLAAELNAIGLHCARQPLLDRRSPDEILGYDDCFSFALAHVRGERVRPERHRLTLP